MLKVIYLKAEETYANNIFLDIYFDKFITYNIVFAKINRPITVKTCTPSLS